MDYKIVEKEAFTVICASRMFKYNSAKEEIPYFWSEHYQKGNGKIICGMYGICIDEKEGMDEFEYLIADDYTSSEEIPDGFVKKTIPKNTWAVFPCRGPMPKALQDVTGKIFSEWLPNCKDYEIAAGYCVEMYTNTADYPNGNQDENYYSEVWIPVRKK
jgi:AraC family transcriptional regulator